MRSRPLAALVMFVTAVLATGCSNGKGSRADSTSTTLSGDSTAATLFGTPTTTRASGNGKSSTTRPDHASGGSTSSTAPVDRHGGPRPGTYQYDTTLSSGTKTQHGNDGFQVVDDKPVDNNGFRQITTWVEGNQVNRMLVAWRAAGHTIEVEQEARGKSVGPLCDWSPDYDDLVFPLKVGAKWSAQTRCDEGHTITRDRTFSAQVTGTEKATVGSTTLDVFVIKRSVSSTQNVGDHRVRVDENYTDKFAPSVGLLISQSGTDQDYLDGIPKGLRTRVRTLESLEPTT